ncbi:MAG: dipeptidyl-peptidase-4 [Candidatus Azotimanducaceae bacterium]|jgi:dipeptidyl-peptidase-4
MSITLQRIFGDPDLNGLAPLQLKLSHDSKQVSYLKASEENFEQLSLWVYDIESDTHQQLVDARTLTNNRTLSDAEKARRERLRITQTGIVEYHWSPSGNALLFPIEGNLFLYRLGDKQPLTQLTDDTTYETDIRFSPNGEWIAFVRSQNLFALNLTSLETRQLTTEGKELVSCGLADFIAQEEMHRYNGYWWSPDSTCIAFTRVDEAPVEVSQRYEIDADQFGVFDQRYPFAGKPNADVTVGVVSLEKCELQWLDTRSKAETYITRVSWFHDNNHLAIQRQSRDQQTLELLCCHRDGSPLRILISEASDSWTNLNDNFTALDNQQFIWGSERSGYNHLYLFKDDGELVRQLTFGESVVADIKAVTSEKIYFDGFLDTPLERHLYSIDRKDPQQDAATEAGKTALRITARGYSHSTSVSRDGSVFVDRFSSALEPPAVHLCSTKGSILEKLEPNVLDRSHPFSPYLSNRGQVSFDEIKAEDGQSLHFRVIKPSSNQLEVEGRSPLILTVYGGPGVQRVSNEWIPPWHHYMASQGYGLLQLDNRGTAHRGKAFESPIYRKMGDIEVLDQLLGIDHLCSSDWVDPNRLAVFGHSYGGYMTLMLMMKSNKFKAGVSVAPVTDWRLYDTHYTERYLGHPDSNAEGYLNSSVFPYAESLTGKLLIIHGMADDNVLFTNSTKLYKTLQDQNTDFEIMNYPGAKHGLSGRRVNIHRYSLMDRFFSQNVANL